MLNKEIILKLLKKNNGVLSSKQAKDAGINNKTLQRLNNLGEIERVQQGIYIDPNILEDEYLLAQYRCPKGIYSHETALFFHDLTDRTPFQLMLTIPSGYNTRLLEDKENYKFFYISPKLHNLGKSEVNSPYRNKIYIYNKERTICDCIKKRDQLDKDIVITAVKKYMKEPGANLAKLLEYSKIFKIENIIKEYMEVLI